MWRAHKAEIEIRLCPDQSELAIDQQTQDVDSHCELGESFISLNSDCSINSTSSGF